MNLPKLRWEIARGKIWKELKASAASITDEEIEAEVVRRIGECPISDAPGARPRAAKPKQLAFAESGQASHETREKAFSASLPRAGSKRALAFEFIRDRGTYGATRDEIEFALPTLSPHSIPSTVLALIGDELIIETNLRRKTRRGFDAVVLIAKECAPTGGRNE